MVSPRATDERARAKFQPLGLQDFTDLGEQRLAEFALVQQAAKFQQCRRVWHPLLAQVDAHKAAQCRVLPCSASAGTKHPFPCFDVLPLQKGNA